MQERHDSSALSMKLHLSCTNPSICRSYHRCDMLHVILHKNISCISSSFTELKMLSCWEFFVTDCKGSCLNFPWSQWWKESWKWQHFCVSDIMHVTKFDQEQQNEMCIFTCCQPQMIASPAALNRPLRDYNNGLNLPFVFVIIWLVGVV